MSGPARRHTAEVDDLVRYAGASGDSNPIHWDADAARAAGLDGCIVHGMLVMAWAAEAVAESCGGDENLRSLKVRFRSPVAAGSEAAVAVSEEADGNVKVEVRGPDDELCVSGSAVCGRPDLAP